MRSQSHGKVTSCGISTWSRTFMSSLSASYGWFHLFTAMLVRSTLRIWTSAAVSLWLVGDQGCTQGPDTWREVSTMVDGALIKLKQNKSSASTQTQLYTILTQFLARMYSCVHQSLSFGHRHQALWRPSQTSLLTRSKMRGRYSLRNISLDSSRNTVATLSASTWPRSVILERDLYLKSTNTSSTKHSIRVCQLSSEQSISITMLKIILRRERN